MRSTWPNHRCCLSCTFYMIVSVCTSSRAFIDYQTMYVHRIKCNTANADHSCFTTRLFLRIYNHTMQIRASRVSGVSGVGGGLSSACLWDGTEKNRVVICVTARCLVEPAAKEPDDPPHLWPSLAPLDSMYLINHPSRIIIPWPDLQFTRGALCSERYK